ncbi:MAG: hypothetical protein ACYS76_10090 [Planctomycetota bacterium]|jgi:hypothetical protein
MSRRPVILGAYAKGILWGLEDVLNNEDYLKVLPRFDMSNFFYTCMVQYGAEDFEIFDFQEDSVLIPSSKHLARRISLRDSNEIEGHIRENVQTMFNEFLGPPSSWWLNKEFQPVHTLSNFLEELLIAAKIKKSVVTLLPVPDLQELQSLIPPELLIPIENFLLNVRSEEVIGPGLPKIIRAKAVHEFQELVESDAFHQFSMAHGSLESSQVLKDKAKADILQTGDNLIRRFAHLVEPKRVCLALLAVTQDLVELVAGNVGGGIAKAFAPVLGDLITAERRVVIYEMTPTLDRLVGDRRRQYVAASEK